MSIKITRADYNTQGDVVMSLLRAYAIDPMGGGEDLPDATKVNLISEMQKRPEICLSFIAWCDDVPVGLANCILGFSTFACQDLLNIHDFTVIPEYRRKGIAGALLAYIEQYAKEKKYCKVTLECLENNLPAKNAYLKHGFKPYELRPQDGKAIFFHKYT
jgi:GNAT superfamily N-acetyltransferase